MKKIIFAACVSIFAVLMSVGVLAADFDDIAAGCVNDEFNQSMASYLINVCYNTDNASKIVSYLESEGFENIETYCYDSSDEDNSAFCIAKKTVNGEPVVLISVRQTNDMEWHGNFNVADNGENVYHESFYIAAQNVWNSARQYIADEFDSAPRVIITGYSRGAAVANIVASFFVDSVCNDVCAYTFATPTVTTLSASDSKYNCIFNIINPEDFVTVAPLTAWGYSRYGRDYVLPTALNYDNYYDLLDDMKALYSAAVGSVYKPFADNSTEKFAAEALRLAPTVDDYYNKKYRVIEYGYMSLREYLDYAAVLMSDSASTSEKLEVYDLMYYYMDGTQYQSITNYLYDNYMNGKLLAAHNIAAYSSWLLLLDEDYFTSQYSDYVHGDATNDGVLAAEDSAYVLQKVLDYDFTMPIENATDDWIDVVDVDGDTLLTATDAAYILQKVLDNDFNFVG